jgi:O-antigen/teichoic acid export membrane protein
MAMTCEEPGIEPGNEPTTTRAPGADTLAQSVLILMVLTVFQRFVGLVRGLVFCRWMSPEELGEWEMCFSFLLFAAPLAILSLPGAFGRYMEQFRVRGLFRLLMQRTAVATLGMASTAAIVLICFRTEFSSWIFGRDDCTVLIAWLTAGLLAVIAFNFMIDVFTGLRMQRIASQLQTVQALSFAAIGLTLLAWYPQGAQSVVIAYGGASLLAFFVALPHLVRAWHTAPRSLESMPQSSFWGKLMPYAVSLWAANWLSNAFLLADRYLIIHCSGMSADDALSQVGQYHTARLVPILILTFAGLLSSILLPHLSFDWETGCRRLVCERMNLFIKGLSLALLGSMAVLLVMAPWLFNLAFGDKFDLALAILPWTIGYCVWASLGYVVRTYLWCDEKVLLSSAAYAVGLVVSIGLNLLLLPAYGLYGAVWGTAGGNLVALLLMVAFAMYRGMEMHKGSWLALILPLAICLGAWTATITTLVTLVLIWRTEWVLNHAEKQQVVTFIEGYLQRFKRFGPKEAAAGN